MLINGAVANKKISIKILMITHNRSVYTELSLHRLCETLPDNAKVMVWDNDSSGKVLKILKRYENHPKIEKIIYNRKNDKLRRPTNWFWQHSKKVNLIGKVDDDCIVTGGWCEKIERFHNETENAGVIACWHFMPDDFNYNVAKKKINTYGKHNILRNCWVGGSGYLMKTRLIEEIGLLRQNESFTDYCIRAAKFGYINGYYYPLILQEHMDDPRAKNSRFRSEREFIQFAPLSAVNFNIKTKDQWVERIKKSARIVQEASLNPSDFLGYKAKLKNNLIKLFQRNYFPRV